MVRPLNNQRGQTSVEWLMLMGVTFIASYFMIRGPVGRFTANMLNNVKTITANIVLTGEIGESNINGGPNNPAAPMRFKALHL